MIGRASVLASFFFYIFFFRSRGLSGREKVMGNAMHLRKVAMTRMRSPGNFSDPSRGQGIFQLLFAARRSIRTHDPLLPRPNQRWWRDSSGLGRAASCQCHDRQRRPQQEKISGDGAGFTLENHGFWLGSRNTKHQKKASGQKYDPLLYSLIELLHAVHWPQMERIARCLGGAAYSGVFDWRKSRLFLVWTR